MSPTRGDLDNYITGHYGEDQFDDEPEETMGEQEMATPETHSNGGMKRSATLGKLVSALTKAQLEFKAVLKDAENPAYTRGTKRSMYATMDSVISATREPLAKNGLTIIALPQEMVDDRRLKITSILIHTSDEFIESTLTMTAVDKVTPQELGKLITYARRYQWTSLTGTAPEDDTDGNESSGVGSREAAQAVGQQKIADFKEKKAKTEVKDYQPAIFYTWFNDSQTARIEGDKDLMHAHAQVLKPLWNASAKAVVANDEQLEALKFYFEERKVPFKMLKEVGQNIEKALKDSLAMKKSNGSETAHS